MDDRDPASSEEGAWLLPSARPRSSRPRRRWRWLVVAIVASLAFVVFVPVAIDRLAQTMSLDLPLPRNVRVGFLGMGGFSRWRCNEGHDHWSAPYWFGGLVLVVVAATSARAFLRSRSR